MTIEEAKQDLLDQISTAGDLAFAYAQAYQALAEAQQVETNTQYQQTMIEHEKIAWDEPASKD